MVILFRILIPFLVLYIVYLMSFHFAAGMLPIWFSILFCDILLSINVINKWFFNQSILRTLTLIGILCFVVIEFIIVFEGTKTSIETDSDYIIVLGAKVNGENMSNSLRRRAELAKEYLDLHPDTKAILSGGQGPDEGISEALAIERFLLEEGISSDRLIKEDQSTSTIENMEFSKKYITKDMEEQGIRKSLDEISIIVISNKFHIHRSNLIASKAGLQTKGLGASTFPLLVPNYYFREFFGVLVTYFT